MRIRGHAHALRECSEACEALRQPSDLCLQILDLLHRALPDVFPLRLLPAAILASREVLTVQF